MPPLQNKASSLGFVLIFSYILYYTIDFVLDYRLYSVFHTVAVLLAFQYAQFLKLQNEATDSGIGRIAEVLLQLFSGKLPITIG